MSLIITTFRFITNKFPATHGMTLNHLHKEGNDPIRMYANLISKNPINSFIS